MVKRLHGGIVTAYNVTEVCFSVLSTPVPAPSNYEHSHKGDNTYKGQPYRNLFIVNDRCTCLQIAKLSMQIIASQHFNFNFFFIHNYTVVHLNIKKYKI